ncbi:MAG: hypothetical protein ACOZNI_30785 [Myxococcota bacterium]
MPSVARTCLPLVALAACSSKWEPVDSGPTGPNPPEVYLTEPGLGTTWSVEDAIPVRAIVTDDLDDPASLVVEIRSDLQGVVATPTLTDDGQLDTTVTLDVGTHQLVIAAFDSLSNEGTDDTTIRVTDAGQPTQPAVDVEPSAPVTGDTLTATILVESTDPEGDALTYEWSWTVDGVDAGLDGTEVAGALVSAGETWEVTVVATDGTNTSAPATRSVVVGNAPPDPGTPYVTPEAPAPGDDLTCNHADPVDPEGDAFTVAYAWIVDGAQVGEAGPVLAGDTLERGDAVYCRVLVDDGVVTEYDSDPVWIGNAPPSVVAVTVTPTAATESTTLTCAASGASDPDGDAITLAYRWVVDGVTGGTGTRLDGASFSRGDAVACEVTPSDAYAAGDTVTSATITVDNSAPTAPSVSFVRTDLVPGVDAECVVVRESDDADGDAIVYEWSWEVDGVPSSVTTSTFDTSTLDPGDVLTCLATPDDGYDFGSPGSADLPLGEPTAGDVGLADAFATVTGSSASGQFGKAVDVVDDIDGDGLAELVIGAPRGDGATYGAAYVFTAADLAVGGDLTDADATWSWVGHTAGDYLGATRGVAGAGDVDGDGIGDVLVSAPWEDTAGTDAGLAYLLYGGEAWTAGADVYDDAAARLTGVTGDWFGARMAAGDLDGDGISDLVLTGPYNDLGGSKAGVLAMFEGDDVRLSGTLAVTSADARVTGAVAGTELGWSLDVLGDMDGDGYNDVAVGIFYDDTNAADAGAAAVISGRDLAGQDTFEDVAFLIVRGLAAGDRFGYDVAGVGDVDGDGLEDVLLGGYLSDEAGTDAGSAALFFGAAGMNREVDADAADASFTGDAAGDQYGSWMSAAGDFDADGIADFLVGGPRSAAGGPSASGAAYLYLGENASTWDTSPTYDVRVLGTTADDWAGDEGVGGFDLTGDGYADFALGAQGADLGASGGGAVFLFTGP